MKKVLFLLIVMVGFMAVSANAQSTTTKSKAQISSEPVHVNTADLPAKKVSQSDERTVKPATTNNNVTTAPVSTSPNAQKTTRNREVINSGNRVDIDRKPVKAVNNGAVKKVNADTKPKK